MLIKLDFHSVQNIARFPDDSWNTLKFRETCVAVLYC